MEKSKLVNIFENLLQTKYKILFRMKLRKATIKINEQ